MIAQPTLDLDDALYDVMVDAPRAADPRAFGSEAGTCSRQVWWRAHGEPVTDPPPLSTLMAFAIGNALHTQVAAAFTLLHPGAETEVAWEQGHVAGRADVVVTSPWGDKRVIEIKTISPFEVKYLREPKREHRLQASVYAVALGATAASIVYVNKLPKSGESPLLAFDDVLDAQAYLEGEDELIRLQSIVTAETLPAPHTGAEALDPRGDFWQCKFCRWHHRCLSEPT